MTGPRNIAVIDTHTFVWWLAKSKKLGKEASQMLRRAEKGQFEARLPAICLFEVGLLIENGRLRTPHGFQGWYSNIQRAQGIVIEPFTEEDAAIAARLPQLIDPFDRMIVAVAKRLDAPLISADERIAEAGIVNTVW